MRPVLQPEAVDDALVFVQLRWAPRLDQPAGELQVGVGAQGQQVHPLEAAGGLELRFPAGLEHPELGGAPLQLLRYDLRRPREGGEATHLGDLGLQRVARSHHRDAAVAAGGGRDLGLPARWLALGDGAAAQGRGHLRDLPLAQVQLRGPGLVAGHHQIELRAAQVDLERAGRLPHEPAIHPDLGRQRVATLVPRGDVDPGPALARRQDQALLGAGGDRHPLAVPQEAPIHEDHLGGAGIQLQVDRARAPCLAVHLHRHARWRRLHPQPAEGRAEDQADRRAGLQVHRLLRVEVPLELHRDDVPARRDRLAARGLAAEQTAVQLHHRAWRVGLEPHHDVFAGRQVQSARLLADAAAPARGQAEPLAHELAPGGPERVEQRDFVGAAGVAAGEHGPARGLVQPRGRDEGLPQPRHGTRHHPGGADVAPQIDLALGSGLGAGQVQAHLARDHGEVLLGHQLVVGAA